jgi:hypothetical protein
MLLVRVLRMRQHRLQRREARRVRGVRAVASHGASAQRSARSSGGALYACRAGQSFVAGGSSDAARCSDAADAQRSVQ